MRTTIHIFASIALAALLLSGFATDGIAQDTDTIVSPDTKAPVILATNPADGEMNVKQNSVIEITFSSEMDAASINSTTLLLHAMYADTLNEEYGEMQQEQITGNLINEDSDYSSYYTTGAVNGSISYANKIAVFTPDQELKENTLYTFTVTNGVKSSENVALVMDQSWGFTTAGPSNTTYFDKRNDRYGMEKSEYKRSTMGISLKDQANLIELGKAGHFVILAKTSVLHNSPSRITGRLGEGLPTSGIRNVKDISKPTLQKASGQGVLKSGLSDTTSPVVKEAIEDMMVAYQEASMQKGNDSTSHKNESFHSVVLSPGVHEWTDSLHITTDVMLSGTATDVWLIKVGDNLTVDKNVVFTLSNGARADNIFWYVEGKVGIGANAQFEGIILSMNDITLEKGAILNGRMFSQTSISLDDNTVIQPGSMAAVKTTSANK